jgi:hypothetical protein
MVSQNTNLYEVKGFLIEATSQQEAEELYPEILKSAELQWLAEYNQHMLTQLTSNNNS